MWKSILLNQPDLWVWLGDNIYADTDNMQAMARMYHKVSSQPDYNKLCAESSIMGIWDDHDYGVNDGDKNYSKRRQSKELMLKFLDVPLSDPVWKHEGAYQAYTIGPAGRQVKFILLDGRYFRDELKANPGGTPRYFVNETGDMLGEAQWKWLEQELKNNKANLTLLCSSVQILADEHNYDKWGNFPSARKR